MINELDCAAVILITLNVPNDALLDVAGTDSVSVFDPPSEVAAVACSFLIGLGGARGPMGASLIGGVGAVQL